MNLSPMRFKNYTWPHNPRVYEIAFKRNLACHKVPFGVYVLQNMGRSYRVLSGDGEFVGVGAYDEFRKLATVFYDNSAGVLFHPVWQESLAYFAKLSLKEVPTENYVAYSFEFWESFDQYGEVTESGRDGFGEPPVNYVTVKPGESFWTLAAIYGVAKLLELNPRIKNPNDVKSGDIIKVR